MRGVDVPNQIQVLLVAERALDQTDILAPLRFQTFHPRFGRVILLIVLVQQAGAVPPSAPTRPCRWRGGRCSLRNFLAFSLNTLDQAIDMLLHLRFGFLLGVRFPLCPLHI